MAEAALNRLKCSVCLNTYIIPKTLPCLHTFCKDCIEECIKKRPTAIGLDLGLSENEISCPNCRQVHTLPSGGVDEIPTNFEIRGIIEVLQGNPISTHNASPFTTKCMDCSKKAIECFCEPCGKLLCAMCALEKHTKDNPQRLNLAYDKHKTLIDEAIGDVVTGCLEVDNALRRNMEVLNKLAQDACNCTSTIKTVFASFRSHLDDREKDLLLALDKIQHGKTSMLDEQRIKLEALKTSLNEAVSQASKFLNDDIDGFFNGKDAIKEMLMKKVEEVCESRLEPVCDSFIEQSCPPADVANINSAIDGFGAAYCQVSPKDCTAEGKGLVEAVVDNESQFVITLRDMFGNACREELAEVLVDVRPVTNQLKPVILHSLCQPEADGTYNVKYTITEKDSIVIKVMVNGIPIKGAPFSVVPSSHDFRKEINFSKVTSDIHEAGGCAVGIHGEVIITDTQRSSVMVFNSEFKLLKRFGSKGSNKGNFSSPKGIAVDNRNMLFIADSGNNRVVVSNIEGDTFKSIGTYGADRKEFVLPNDVALGQNKDQKQLIFVADTYNHRVQVLNLNGLFVAKFGTEGTGHGSFKFPQGVTTSTDGLVFISDTGNKRIQVFSPNWKFLHIFDELMPEKLPISKPIRITASEDNYILIADLSGVVIANSRGELIKVVKEYKPVAICCTRIKELGTFLAICEAKHAYLGQPS